MPTPELANGDGCAMVRSGKLKTVITAKGYDPLMTTPSGRSANDAVTEAIADIRLSQYSHGAGCGCKIAPAILDRILSTQREFAPDPALLVGNQSRDDAAAYDLGDGQVILSTTDFFMPIVDDAFDFGRIAATNAISDIYAMGGRPLMAIAILGWPLDKLPPELAAEVVDGGRQVCSDAGMVLAGGHSIDCPEPVFGLAVTGLVTRDKLKQNDTAIEGCLLYLTKPLGIGVLTTAEKRGLLSEEHKGLARDQMCQLNKAGQTLATLPGVRAMTDVTGFGLAGHLLEMCKGSALDATVNLVAIPSLPGIESYIEQGCVPGGTQRNLQSYGSQLAELDPAWQAVLCDPQTSGGLLLAVEPEARESVEAVLRAEEVDPALIRPIGKLQAQSGQQERIRFEG
jgi:selenide,water dikinase